MKKRVLESYPFLDIDQLMKYKKNHRVAVSVEFGSQALRVRLNLESLQGCVDGEEVFLDKSDWGYGGFRYWFPPKKPNNGGMKENTHSNKKDRFLPNTGEERKPLLTLIGILILGFVIFIVIKKKKINSKY